MTTARFRNVDVVPGSPVEEWPDEAIETVMDRGSLSDWARLAAAIRSQPWGPLSRTVESVAGWDEHYGVDRLMLRVLATARRDYDAAGRARYAALIRSWRHATGLSQRAFARLAGTSPSRLSDYENAKVAPTTDVLGRIEGVAHSATRSRHGATPEAEVPIRHIQSSQVRASCLAADELHETARQPTRRPTIREPMWAIH